MTTVPLGLGAYNRTFGNMPEIELVNRFFEKNPTNQVEGTALLARPGDTLFRAIGFGPIRQIAFQDGVFNKDLFVVSGDALFRYDGVTLTAIGGVVQGSGNPAITFVAGPDYERLFISDGVTLQFYDGLSSAKASLTMGATGPLAAEQLVVDGVFYEFTAGSVDAGAPDGTMVNPFLLSLTGDQFAVFARLDLAINAKGVAGTDYSTALTVKHTTVSSILSTPSVIDLEAVTPGVAGNSIAVSETFADSSLSSPTLLGGGSHTLSGVVTPDDVPIVALATINSFIIAVKANSQRFFWIKPAAITIDALDFAEAEAEPDQILDVMRIGDSLYFLGQSFTEVWYATGDALDPFRRQQGLAFNQGILPGTAVAIRTQIALIANDGIAYQITGGPERFSNYGVEERIRKSREGT